MTAAYFPQWPGDPGRYPGWALEQHSAHCLALRLPDTTHPSIIRPMLTPEAIHLGELAKKMLLEMEAWVPKGYIRNNRSSVKDDAMRRDFRIAGFWGGRGGSKCVAPDTKIRMFSGLTKSAKSIKVGDLVMGINSEPRKVLSTTVGYGPMYRIDQTSAESYEVNGDHILSLLRHKSASSKKGKFHPNTGNYQYKNGIYHQHENENGVSLVTVDEYVKWSNKKKSLFHGFKRGYEKPDVKLPIDPYFIGLWLGDGSKATPIVASGDIEVIQYLRGVAKHFGISLTEIPKRFYYGFNNGGKLNPVTDALRSLNLINNKHIPKIIFKASRNQRLEFLAGYADSDGSIKNGTIIIGQKDYHLAKGVKRIADSLGFKTSLRKRTGFVKQINRDYTCYAVSISGNNIDEVPTKIRRKKLSTDRNKDKSKTMIQVSPVGDGEYCGFELDGDHLFLLADGTVTHNSHGVCEAIVELSSVAYERVVCGREFMASIRDSSRSLLASKVRKSRYSKDWVITDRELKNNRTGSLITFLGVNRNTDNLRSLEGCTLFFGEEAESFAQESLDILIPTVRAPGSRFIFCWNPTFGGPVDEMLRMGLPPERSIVRGVLTEDNVWFYKTELPSERRSSFRKHKILKFRHIWRGDLDTNPDVLVYNNWSIGRIEIPHNVSPIYGLDWGWTDPLAMTQTWIIEPDDPNDETTKAKMYIDRQIYGSKIPISHLPRMIKEDMPLATQFTIVADSSEPKSIDYMNSQGFHVIPAAKGPGSVRSGISDIHGYDVYINPDCQDVINEFGSYRWKKTKTGIIVRDPVDAENHTLDSIRYAKESYSPLRKGDQVIYI